MQFSNSSFALLTVVIVLTACHSAPPAAPESASSQSQPQVPAPTVNAPAAKPQQPAHPAQKIPKSEPTLTASAQDIAQLDLDSEGGVRDGSYAMWVHVTEGGKSVSNLPVLAFNTSNKLAAAARTNEDGDAMLKVQATTYRITATRGRWHAQQTVTYHPGNQFELTLQH
jgi:hypothetical protein